MIGCAIIGFMVIFFIFCGRFSMFDIVHGQYGSPSKVKESVESAKRENDLNTGSTNSK